MSESQNQTPDADEAVVRALATHTGDDVVVDPEIALTAVHVPGTPLAREADEASSRAFEAELLTAHDDTHESLLPVEYAGIDTRTADANYETRSNIVRP